MKVTLLGTGSPEANTRRASSGYLVEVGADRILLDCGGGVFDRLLEAGLLPSDITHVFFTHLHSDHMMDYARLVHAAWDEGAAPLQVFGPAPIERITDQYFGPDGVFSTDLRARTENPGSQAVWVVRGGELPRPWPAPQVKQVKPGFRHETDNWVLSSCEVPHAQPWLDCMALRIDTGDAGVVYCGDSGWCRELESLAQGADLLIHWLYRLPQDDSGDYIKQRSPVAADIAQMAQRASVKQLVYTHLRPHMDTPEHHRDILASAGSHFDGRVQIAEDLDSFKFAGK